MLSYSLNAPLRPTSEIFKFIRPLSQMLLVIFSYTIKFLRDPGIKNMAAGVWTVWTFTYLYASPFAGRDVTIRDT